MRNNSVNIFRDSMPFCLETKMSSLPNKSVIVYWSPGVKDLLNLYLTRNCLFLPHITNAAMSPNKHEWKHSSEIGPRCPSGPDALDTTPPNPKHLPSCSAPAQPLPPNHPNRRSASAMLRTPRRPRCNTCAVRSHCSLNRSLPGRENLYIASKYSDVYACAGSDVQRNKTQAGLIACAGKSESMRMRVQKNDAHTFRSRSSPRHWTRLVAVTAARYILNDA